MRYERFRLKVRPAELTAFDRSAVLSRASLLLLAHPGIGVEDITKARSSVDISVRLETEEPADEIVSDVLRRALGLPEAARQFRRIPLRASRGESFPLRGMPGTERLSPADAAQSPRRSRGIPSPLREPSSAADAAPGGFPDPLYADAPRSTGAQRGPVRSEPPRRRRMVGQCPDTVRVGETFSLLVRIGVSEGGAELKSFAVPAEGLDVLIVVHAPGLRVLGGERQMLRVPAEGDSEPSMFELVADSPGARKISITAWQQGSYLGELLVDLAALADTPASGRRACGPSCAGNRGWRCHPGGALRLGPERLPLPVLRYRQSAGGSPLPVQPPGPAGRGAGQRAGPARRRPDRVFRRGDP